jgi:N-acetylmuramoyl-L-alanine amidase
MIEVGNLNNTVNAQTITDPEFQNRLVTIITNAVQRFSATEPVTSN